MKTIGITAHQVVIGKNIRTVEQIASFCTKDECAEMHRIGLEQVPTDNDTLLEDMLAEAWQRFADSTPDYVLVAHSLPFVRRSYHDLNFFGAIPVFYLSGLPCVIMHKAVDIACKMIESGQAQRIVVIGADKAYSDHERVFFNTIMGDAIVLLFLEYGASHDQILSRYISTTIFAANGENSEPENVQRFRNFNTAMMRDAIQKCMQKAGIGQIDHFVTHTSNRKFWDGVSKLCGYPREIFLDENIRNTGHMNSHDSFLHYFFWREQGKIKANETVMLINPGFGGSQGCTLIRA